MEDVIIVGAGPCGISAAIELQKAGFRPIIIEKENVVHSIYLYPAHLQFFSTPELLEIGDIPFTTPNEKPYRQEALAYYRKVVSHYNLDIRPYEKVTSIRKVDDLFEVQSEKRSGAVQSYSSRYVVLATGYFDHPNMIGIPGEDLSKVTHYYREAHPYAGMKVAIVGGSNSAVDAALELMRVGAEVTVLYRGESFSNHIKPWVRPIFESMIAKGKIKMLFQTSVTRIDPDTITVSVNGEERILDNDFVLALTGFRPDRTFLRHIGVQTEGVYAIPVHNKETMETNVEGLYIAGVIASGADANEIFIETGRNHGKRIASNLIMKRPG